MRLSKPSVIEVLGFDDTKTFLIGIPVISFAMPLLFFRATLADGLMAYLPNWGVSLMYTVAYWFSIRSIFILMRRRFGGHQQIRKRIFYSILLVVLVFFTLNTVIGLFHRHDYNDVTDFDYNVASFTITALVSAIYESIFLYDRWKRSIMEAEQLRRENIESQLEGLKSQVNPHFLFNSLNTLAYIIPDQPAKAVEFVQQLAKVYRYILDMRDKQLISLEEELGFLEAFLFLLKTRFGDNLIIHTNISKELRQLQIVPLSLQILLENAVKHNIISKENPLTIELIAENAARLTVRNNLQLKSQEMPSTHLGLQNIKNRYAFFSDAQVEVTAGPQYFAVTLPLLEKV